MKPVVTGAGLRCLNAMDVLGFQSFFAGNHLEGDDVTFIEGFKTGPVNRRVMTPDLRADG
jgi:hypothetical protein